MAEFQLPQATHKFEYRIYAQSIVDPNYWPFMDTHATYASALAYKDSKDYLAGAVIVEACVATTYRVL